MHKNALVQIEGRTIVQTAEKILNGNIHKQTNN